MTTNEPNQPGYNPPESLLVPSRELASGVAFSWLQSGWSDFRNAPGISLVYGFVVFLVSNTVAWLAWKLGGFVLLISVMTLIGFLTAGLGLIVIIPWLAYATWHGYRDALDVSELPKLPGKR